MPDRSFFEKHPFPNWVVSVAEGVLSNALFWVITIIGSLMLAGAILVRNRRRNAAIEKAAGDINKSSYINDGLLTITNFDFSKLPEHVRAYLSPNNNFFLEIPARERNEILALLPTFNVRTPVTNSLISAMQDDARQIIPDLDSLVDKSRTFAAEALLARIKNAARTFNGIVFHAYELRYTPGTDKHGFVDRLGKRLLGAISLAPSATADSQENPTIDISLYKTDYFTLLTLFETFKAVRDRKEVRDQWKDQKFPHMLRFLFTGVGLNCLLCAINDQDPKEKFLLFRKRSARALVTKATGLYHVTANEAMSETDVSYGEIDFDQWIIRALKEEVGILGLEKDKFDFEIQGSFLYLEDLQPGFTAVAFCRFETAKLQSMINRSRDGLMEYGELRVVPFTDSAIRAVLVNGPGLDDEGGKVPFSAIAENILRQIDAEGTSRILQRLKFIHKRQ